MASPLYARQSKYRKTEKGKAATHRYNHSAPGKAAKTRYQQKNKSLINQRVQTIQNNSIPTAHNIGQTYTDEECNLILTQHLPDGTKLTLPEIAYMLNRTYRGIRSKRQSLLLNQTGALP